MGESGSVLLDLFRRLEPGVTTGIIGDSLTIPSKLELHMTAHSSHWSNRNVLLLDRVAASGDDTISAIDLLRARGVSDDRITVVALFVAAEVVTLIQCMRPGVRIVTTGVGDLIPHDHSRP
jgi:uracil phosphoribosyltransferase